MKKLLFFTAALLAVTTVQAAPMSNPHYKAFIKKVKPIIVSMKDKACRGEVSFLDTEKNATLIRKAMLGSRYMQNPSVPLGFVSVDRGNFMFLPDFEGKLCVIFTD